MSEHQPPSDAPPVLALVTDMIFSSRIAAEARACGAVLKIIRQPAQLENQLGKRLIVDLNLPGAIPAAAAWGKATGKQVIGFVSHEDRATIDEARAAGVGQIMPRSRFVQVLSQLLTDAPH